ncbi:hypothetical protein cco71_04291 [Campylobacter coli 317/04]|nr:hypothetical protein cco71_04291 [Campylobacter coli 317/04]
MLSKVLKYFSNENIYWFKFKKASVLNAKKLFFV